MKLSRLFPFLAVAATLAFWLSAAGLPPALSGSASGTWKVDPIHSSVVFRIKHFDVAYFYGRFNTVNGTITLDDDPAKVAIEVEIKAADLDTNNLKRDAHLRSQDFFSVKEFPKITFKSTSAKKAGEKVLDVTGDLTLHGVTKSVSARLTLTGAGKDTKGKERAGGEAHLFLKRSDFGMKYMVGPLSDEVQVIISLEGVKQ